MLSGNSRQLTRSPEKPDPNWVYDELSEKIQNIHNWVRGPGEKLLTSQNAKPYSFEEAILIRKNHEQFEFKCMKALEDFALLCEYRKHNIPSDELNELDFLVQSYIDRLNKRTFFVVSCYSYFRLIEELWNILEDVQKRSHEVDTYDSVSIKNAITELEIGLEKSEARLNNLAHELDRLKVILAPSDPVYLGQLEKSFDDVCKTASERMQDMRIRKLILKKHSKLLECEDNVYESIGWIEELMDNIELLYQENCVGRNHLDSVSLLEKSLDIYKQAKTTQAYSSQLLETYIKLCEADRRRIPRGIELSRNRLLRVWPRLEHRLREFRERTEAAESVYSQTDLLLKRVQDCLLEASRNPPISQQLSGSPDERTRPDILQSQIQVLNEEFVSTKNLALALIDRLPKGLLNDDAPYAGPVIEEVSRLIRLKLYTLWLKLREYEYIVNGYNVADNTTASELGLDTMRPLVRSRSTNSTMRHPGSSFDAVDDMDRYATTHLVNSLRFNRSIQDWARDIFQPVYSPRRSSRRSGSMPRSHSVPESSSKPPSFPTTQDSARFSTGPESSGRTPLVMSSTERPLKDNMIDRKENGFPESFDKSQKKDNSDATQSIRTAYKQFERTLESLKPRQTERVDDAKRHRLRQDASRAWMRLENRISDHVANAHDPESPVLSGTVARTRDSSRRLYERWIADSSNWIPPPEQPSNRLRLRDLENDLLECQTRLHDLIHAASLMTAQHCHSIQTSPNEYVEASVWKNAIAEPDVERLDLICEEANGMTDTIPAQEKFISNLLSELKSDHCLAVDLPRVDDIWMTYKEQLLAFNQLMNLLSTGYHLVPRIEAFKTQRAHSLRVLRKLTSDIAALQTEGGQLLKEISQFVEPDLLTPAATKVTELTDAKVRAEWLILLLRREMKTIQSNVEEVELLVSNLQTESSTEHVDLTAIMPNSLTASGKDVQQDTAQIQAETLNGYVSSKSASAMSTAENSRASPAPFVVQVKKGERYTPTKPSVRLQLVQPLEDATVGANEPATLSCRFDGVTDASFLQVQWTFQPVLYKHGQVTWGTPAPVTLTETTLTEVGLDYARLKFLSPGVESNGVYTARILNSFTGEELNTSAQLEVRPRITKPLSDFKVPVLDSLTGRLMPVRFSIEYCGFTCTPTIRWVHNGERLDESVWVVTSDRLGSSIYSNTARLVDKGAFDCHIKDPSSGFELHSSAQLYVEGHAIPKPHASLQIGDNDRSGSAAEGEQLIIRCPLPTAVKGKQFSVDWLHNDKVIYTFRSDDANWDRLSNGNTFQSGQTVWRTYVAENYCVLATNAVHQSDHGRYVCCIYTDEDVFESTGDVIISEKLRFCDGLEDLTVFVGEPFRLQCRLNQPVDGISPQLQINWYLNGESIDTNSSDLISRVQNDLIQLSTNHATEQHDGLYCCELKCGDMAIRTECRVGVKAATAPKITRIYREPSGSLSTGQTLVVTVHFQAQPAPTCLWTKDNVPLDETDIQNEIAVEGNTCSLKLPNVQPGHEGYYELTLTNNQGEDIIGEFLNVDQGENIEPEKPARIPIEIVRQAPTVSAVPTVDDTSNVGTEQPTIKPEVDLFLLSPPDICGYPGDTIKVLSIVACDDPILCVWFHEEQPLKSGSSYRMHNDFPRKGVFQLEIRQLTYTDRGLYKVGLYRPDDREYKSPIQVKTFELNVQIPETPRRTISRIAPHFPQDGLPTRTCSYIGGETILSCRVAGNPQPSFCWLKHMKFLAESDIERVQISQEDSYYTLRISNTKKEDSGLWELVCYNPYGFILTSSKLRVTDSLSKEHVPARKSTSRDVRDDGQPPSVTVHPGPSHVDATLQEFAPSYSSDLEDIQPPDFQTIFTDMNIQSGEPLRLKCQITGCPTPAVRWTINNRIISADDARYVTFRSGHQYSLMVERASVNDSGRYSCTAENVAGIATCSAVIFVSTAALGRADSPVSEPGYYTHAKSHARASRNHIDQVHEHRHSGTQTPTNQRVSLIRSLSNSMDPANWEHSLLSPSLSRTGTCKYCKRKEFSIREPTDDNEEIFDRRQLLSSYPKTRRRRSHSQYRRSRHSTMPERLLRHRSEEALLPICTHCHTRLKQRSSSMDFDKSCIRCTQITEHVFVDDPSTLDSNRYFLSPTAKRSHHERYASTYSTSSAKANRVVSVRPTSKSSERPVPIRLLSGDAVVSEKHPTTTERILTKTYELRSQTVPSATKVEQNGSSHSVVESSDGEGN